MLEAIETMRYNLAILPMAVCMVTVVVCGPVNSTKNPCASATPMMGADSVSMFTTYLVNAQVYFEWGSGRSTIYAAAHVDHVISVEGSLQWCTMMLQQPSSLTCWIRANRVSYLCLQLGPISKRFATPHSVRSIRSRNITYNVWQPYISVIDAYEVGMISLVLVDGRFRVACALKALPHLIASNGTLLLHDAHRSKYDTIRTYYDTVLTAGSLHALRPKQHLTSEVVKNAWLNYRTDHAR